MTFMSFFLVNAMGLFGCYTYWSRLSSFNMTPLQKVNHNEKPPVQQLPASGTPKLSCRVFVRGERMKLRRTACPGLPPDVPYGETLMFEGSCSQLSWISSSCTKPSAIVAEELEMDQPGNSSFEGCGAVLDQMRGDRRWQHYNLMDAVQMVCGNRTCLPMPDCMDEVHQNLERYPPDSLVGRARAFCPTAAELWGRRWFKAFETVVHSLNQSRPHDMPPKDALVVHLRLGDVLEESAASVDEMLANPVPFYSGENELETWNFYVRPLSSFNKSIPRDIVRRRHVVLVASAVHAGRNTSIQLPLQLKSCLYLRAVSKYLQVLGAKDVSFRLGNPPDEDVLYMLGSQFFVVTGGSFSGSMGRLVARNHGTVYRLQ